MQWTYCEIDLPEAERHDKTRILAMVSDTLDKAYAEQGRKYTAIEKRLNSELQVCGTAGQTNRGLEVELVVRHIRLDSGRST